MILNCSDQLGSAYCDQLASESFNLILCGSPIDNERMKAQAAKLEDRYKVRTLVLLFNYDKLANDLDAAYQEISEALKDYDVSILVNNQAYTVPFDYGRADLLH